MIEIIHTEHVVDYNEKEQLDIYNEIETCKKDGYIFSITKSEVQITYKGLLCEKDECVYKNNNHKQLSTMREIDKIIGALIEADSHNNNVRIPRLLAKKAEILANAAIRQKIIADNKAANQNLYFSKKKNPIFEYHDSTTL